MKCPKCNTESGYVRSRKNEWVCRKCGTVTPLQKVKPASHTASSKKAAVKSKSKDTKAKKKSK